MGYMGPADGAALLTAVCRKVPLSGVFPAREGCSGVSLAPAPGEEAPYRG